MKLFTLGGLRLEGSDFARPKPLLLLAYLAIEGPQGRRHLAELFWQGAKDPKSSLRVALAQLRKAGPDTVHDQDHRVATIIPCDAPALLEQIERADVDNLTYLGSFLDGFYLQDVGSELEEWVYGTREFLADRVRDSLLAHAEVLARRNDTARAVGVAEQALDVAGAGPAEPEQLERAYVLLKAANHRRAVGIASELKEYGLEPPAASAQAVAALIPTSPPEVPNNLATPITSFVGREAELQSIADLLDADQERLITLLGTAGVGKTRLSIQAALDALATSRYPNGVYWVGLDTTTDPDQIGERIAEVLGFTPQGADPVIEQTIRYLKHQQMLLVLDNFEQLIEAALILTQLIHQCPHLTLIVTTRERLSVDEEYVLRVEGLPYPTDTTPEPDDATRFEAIRLFLLRAQRAEPTFRLNHDTLTAILHICRLVEGAPLGLELAAAWTRVLPVTDIATELQAGLDNLTARSRGVPDRHRSLQAAFEHSWNLLTERERQVLKRLAVFRGGFRRDAAADVTGATLPLLADLVDKSLLRLAPNGRYDRHPLLYQFSYNKLAENPDELLEYRVRHGVFFLHDGLRHLELVDNSSTPDFLQRAIEDVPNLVAAWSTYLEQHDAHSVAQLAHYLGYISELWGLSRQGDVLMHRAIATFDGNDDASRLARARAQGMLVMTSWRLGRFEEGVRLATEALPILLELEPPNHPPCTWWALQGRGICLFQLGRIEAAIASMQQGYDFAVASEPHADTPHMRKLTDTYIGMSAHILALSYALLGEIEKAKPLAQEGYLRVGRSSPRAAAYTGESLALVALAEGDYPAAEKAAREALEHAKRVGHDVQIIPMEAYLGRALFFQSRYEEAAQLLVTTLERVEQTGDRPYGTPARAIMGRSLVRLQRHEDAVPHLLRAMNDAIADGAIPMALDDALLGLAELAEAQKRFDLATYIASTLAELGAAQSIVREAAQAISWRLAKTGVAVTRAGAQDLDDLIVGLRAEFPISHGAPG